MLSKIKEKIGENIILAAIPVLGYTVALVYEYGYSEYFGYPSELIVVDFEMTLTSTAWVVFYFYLIAFFFDFYAAALTSQKTLGKTIGRVLQFSLLPFIFLFISAFEKFAINLFLISIVIGILFCVIPPLFKMKENGYKKAYINELNDEFSYSVNKSDTLVDKFGVYLFMFAIFLGVCHGAGKMRARDKEEFYKFNHNNKVYILIASYGDNFIGASLDPNNLQLTKKFSIFNSSSHEITEIEKFKIINTESK